MNKENIILTAIAFVIITIFLYLWNMRKLQMKNGKKKRNKVVEITEIKYLVLTYGLKKEKMLNRKFILLISLLDALIISLVFLIIVLLPWKIYWQLLLGFVLLMGLIYSIYGILGRILIKKGYKK